MTTCRTSEVIMAVVVLAFHGGTMLSAQRSVTRWDSAAELREWVAIAEAPGSAQTGIQGLVENGTEFVRIQLAEVGSSFLILNPNLPEFNIADVAELPTLMTPETHTTIRFRMRHNLSLRHLIGFYAYRNAQYTEGAPNLPRFEPGKYSVPGDGQWHEVTLSLKDSPYFDEHDDVVAVSAVLWDADLTVSEVEERYSAAMGNGFIDIDVIEFTRDDLVAPKPQITGISPTRGRFGDLVTIVGSDFSEPADSNVVFFANVEAEIESGTETEILVRPIGGSSPAEILIRTRGGGIAVGPEPFIFIGRPTNLVVVVGDGQSGTVGSSLSPIVVKLSDIDGEGIPGESVSFRIESGGGELMTTQQATDSMGLASTVLTLPPTPGAVTVEARFRGLVATINAEAVNP